jgi:hypothetical protein
MPIFQVFADGNAFATRARAARFRAMHCATHT